MLNLKLEAVPNLREDMSQACKDVWMDEALGDAETHDTLHLLVLVPRLADMSAGHM